MTTAKANLILLFVSLIWGISFVFQREAMDYMGPFSFNAFRFLLGGLVLLPIIWKTKSYKKENSTSKRKALFKGAFAAGLLMFCGAGFQQFGIQYTTLANVGFITGLYIVFVPIIGIFLGHRYKHGIWIAILIAATGLYLLSGAEGFTMAYGDLLVLMGAVFWAIHVIVIDHMSSKHDQVSFAALQFFFCAALSYAAALAVDDKALITTFEEWKWVLASGIVAVGLGYTLQVIGQTVSPPTQAAVIMSLEAVFAALAGYVVYDETLGTKALIGCTLMLGGCLMAQLFPPLDVSADQPSRATN